ncbi:hypothetical protein [Frondihabitans australicus]|uniref:DUF4279 domain-containing protein n=1 Tax=Frondihabitans australicus TaxID=386892 RepID=A0A495IIW9_9MICO|nr:hypothetical protein [Frondihabitans australicus]RKR75927.1 hypothetical protein C8E83_3091 [Frondihabitans australicus]
MDDDEADDGHVIFSLLVNSEERLDALAGFPGRARAAAPVDDHLYEVYETSFDDADWASRAERLDSCIHEAVDALVGTGVSLDALGADDVLVRAFFTFPRGAETLSAEAVQRLASCHATIWIDFHG